MTAPRTAPGDGLPLHTSISEREFQDLVLQAANLGGWLAYHTHDSRRSVPGFPDLVLVRAGSLMFVELKRQNGRVTRDQAQWLEQLGDVETVESFVWRPSDWPDIEARLLTRPPTGWPGERPRRLGSPDVDAAVRHGAFLARAKYGRTGRPR